MYRMLMATLATITPRATPTSTAIRPSVMRFPRQSRITHICGAPNIADELIPLREHSRRSKYVLDDSCDQPEAIIVRRTKPTSSLSRIMPALIHIQAHLDQDLSL